MWLFSSPTNYNEMVEKISKSLFKAIWRICTRNGNEKISMVSRIL